ncbi:ABC transporter permease [Metabacillus sp. HB246100]
MNSIEEIWKTRINHHINETRSYLKYMLNDHLLFVFIFLAAGGALTYSRWLQSVSTDFPAVLIMTIVFTLILITSSVRTLLKDADIMFLLPMEHKMESYFKKAMFYSFISQSGIIAVTLILFTPLYGKVMNSTGVTLLISLLLLLLMKYWNVRVSWKIDYFTEKTVKVNDLIVRLAINACGIYFIFAQQSIFFLIVLVIMALYDLYFGKVVGKKALKWEQLIIKEEGKKQSFYKLANLFTDVPKLKKQAKRRKYLDFLLKQVAYHQDHVYEYLFLRAFLRTGDYLGIMVRLTLIGSVIIMFLNEQLIGNLLVILLFLFLTGIQMMSLAKHFELLELPQLYPRADQKKVASFLKIVFRILVVQVIIYSVIPLMKGNILVSGSLLAIGLGFAALFVYGYMAGRVRKT